MGLLNEKSQAETGNSSLPGSFESITPAKNCRQGSGTGTPLELKQFLINSENTPLPGSSHAGTSTVFIGDEELRLRGCS